MTEKKETLIVRANVEITADSLKAVVENVKEIAGPDEKGVYRVDPAEKVSEMISRFLLENDFESFVKNIDNYRA
ncbi:MAG: hypothetical protein JRI47_04100 [Deltaproteobacteria bacterium]|nr:hypothetical protein [Deltaproteobacteria bacterium]